MEPENKRLGWTDICCICGQCVVSYHNPEPLRDGGKANCCDACNRLVIAARKRIACLPAPERKAYARMLEDLPYEALKRNLYES